MILCYRHFIHALDMPGDAECISDMSHDLVWHWTKNMLEAEMKACFSAMCKYWVRWPHELSTQLHHSLAWPALSTHAHPHYLHKCLQNQVRSIPGTPLPPQLTPIPAPLTTPRIPKHIWKMCFRAWGAAHLCLCTRLPKTTTFPMWHSGIMPMASMTAPQPTSRAAAQ